MALESPAVMTPEGVSATGAVVEVVVDVVVVVAAGKVVAVGGTVVVVEVGTGIVVVVVGVRLVNGVSTVCCSDTAL